MRALALALPVLATSAAELPLEQIKLPPGFRIELLARVPNARAMAFGAKGTLFIGSRQEGKVYALRPGSRTPLVIASGLKQPAGVAFRHGDLYVSAINRIVKFPDIENRLEQPPPAQTVRADFPDETHHGWKFIAFGPDGKLYVPVGAPCNNCEPDPKRYANIQRMQPDGTGLELVASGVRNTVGFDWQPGSGALWFTDNGRDWLGEDQPDDELNRLEQPGQHFGYPYCHAGDVVDPEFGRPQGCKGFVPPQAKLGAHVAALGMRFYTGKQFPAEYRGQIFIAEHGSWNRLLKTGYQVLLVSVNGARVTGQTVFASGWLRGQKAWGRPVDVVVAPDGALLVSDDHADAIYRISYGAAGK